MSGQGPPLRSDDGILGDGQRIGGVAHQHPVLIHLDILVGDGVGQGGTCADDGPLHQDAVGDLGACLHNDAAGEDGVFHLALDEAAVRHQGVD